MLCAECVIKNNSNLCLMLTRYNHKKGVKYITNTFKYLQHAFMHKANKQSVALLCQTKSTAVSYFLSKVSHRWASLSSRTPRCLLPFLWTSLSCRSPSTSLPSLLYLLFLTRSPAKPWYVRRVMCSCRSRWRKRHEAHTCIYIHTCNKQHIGSYTQALKHMHAQSHVWTWAKWAEF